MFVRSASSTRKLHLAWAVSCVCTALAEELPADEDHIEHRFPADYLDYLLRNSNLAGLPCRCHLSRSWSTMHNRVNISGTNVMVHTKSPVVRDWFQRHVPNVFFATMALNCSKNCGLSSCDGQYSNRTLFVVQDKDSNRSAYVRLVVTKYSKSDRSEILFGHNIVFGIGSARWPDGPPQSGVAHGLSLIPV